MSIDWTPEAVTAAGTVAIAFLTFVLAFGTIFLWTATKRLVKGAEDTAERQLRAYVFPVEAGLKKLNAGDNPEYRIVIYNTGQTPAYKLVHIGRFALVDFPLIEPLPEAEIISEGFSRTNLGPGGKMEKVGSAGRSLSTDAIDRLKAGKAALYAYGTIHFVDAFRNLRWIKYRYMTGGNVGFRSDGKLATCQEGNETSEDEI
jgi:hypothetical protein